MDIEKLECAIRDRYPDLRLIIEQGKHILKGSFPILYEGQVLDRFSIEITFPYGINKLPHIQEVGGRIPRTADRHNSKGICVEVPELILLQGSYSLLSYLDGPVRNYFLSQSLFEKGDPWPFGERAHGKDGVIQAYEEVLDVAGEAAIKKYLDCLGHKKIKGHWPCPCGSGKQIRQCHVIKIQKLKKMMPLQIARQAIKRLNQEKNLPKN